LRGKSQYQTKNAIGPIEMYGLLVDRFLKRFAGNLHKKHQTISKSDDSEAVIEEIKNGEQPTHQENEAGEKEDTGNE